MHRRTRLGFTMIELLVVIGIITVLIALLLPAVLRGRAAARRTQCSNHMKQLGIALTNYQSGHRVFPPAVIWRDSGSLPWASAASDPYVTAPRNVGQNWMLLILPFMEQESTLFSRLNIDHGMPEPPNLTVRSYRMASYMCPADSFIDERLMNLYGGNWGRGSYGAVPGVGLLLQNGTRVGINRYWPETASMYTVGKDRVAHKARRGIMGFQGSASDLDALDGLSKTAMVWEMRAYLPDDPRGVWALSKIGSSIVGDCWGDGHDCRGINDTNVNGESVYGALSAPDRGLGCSVTADVRSSPRSLHDGGCHVLFGDGTVTYVGQSLDLTIGSAMDTIAGNETYEAKF